MFAFRHCNVDPRNQTGQNYLQGKYKGTRKQLRTRIRCANKCTCFRNPWQCVCHSVGRSKAFQAEHMCPMVGDKCMYITSLQRDAAAAPTTSAANSFIENVKRANGFHIRNDIQWMGVEWMDGVYNLLILTPLRTADVQCAEAEGRWRLTSFWLLAKICTAIRRCIRRRRRHTLTVMHCFRSDMLAWPKPTTRTNEQFTTCNVLLSAAIPNAMRRHRGGSFPFSLH